MSDTATTTQDETTTPAPTPTTTAIYLDPEQRKDVDAKWLGKHVAVKLLDGTDKLLYGRLALVSIDPDNFDGMRGELLIADGTRRGFLYGTDVQIVDLTMEYILAPRSDKWVARNAGKTPRAARATGIVTRGTGGASRGVNNSTKTLRMLKAEEVGQDIIDSINAVAAMLEPETFELPGRPIRDYADIVADEPEDDMLDALDALINADSDDPTPENTGYGDFDYDGDITGETPEEAVAALVAEAHAEEASDADSDATYERDDAYQGDPEEAPVAAAAATKTSTGKSRKRGK